MTEISRILPDQSNNISSPQINIKLQNGRGFTDNSDTGLSTGGANGGLSLTSDEWAMYKCLKNSSIEEGSSLHEFFGNVHEKITNNVAEKHLLAAQSQDLKDSLARNLNQIEANEQALNGYHQDGNQIDAQLIQMKQSEKKLLEQNVMTNQHLLAQIESAVHANIQQYSQLRSYMTQNLPSVLSKVVQKMVVEREAQIRAEISAQKDQEIFKLKQALLKMQQKEKEDELNSLLEAKDPIRF